MGKGQLAGGKAEVKLDPDFAAVVHAEDYLIFLTPKGDSRGLTVATQSAGGFTVQELAGGTGAGAFYWRVVAKPKTDKKTSRLEKFVPPEVKLPDPATLGLTNGEPTKKPASPPDAPPPAALPSPAPPSRTAAPAAAPQGSAPASPSGTVPPAPQPRSG
jgi:hypothetical protein